MKHLHHPNEIWLGANEYSLWQDWKVNRWLFVAALISGACDIVFVSAVQKWSIALQVAAALAPFAALLLWVFSLVRWVGGMDEMHRRIASMAILVSIGASFFFVMLWHRLALAGAFDAIFPAAAKVNGSWDIATVGHVFLLLTFFYFAACRFLSRRFQ